MFNEAKNTFKAKYLALRVSPESNSLIIKHCNDNNIDTFYSMYDDRMHVTLLNSEDRILDLKLENFTHECSFDGFDIFNSSHGIPILVIKLNAPTVFKRHQSLIDEHHLQDMRYRFVPHISICYNFNDSVEKLSPIDFPIFLESEYVSII